MLTGWLAVTDSSDWTIALHPATGETVAERSLRRHAKARLMSAFNILYHPLPSGASRAYLARLRKTRDGERKAILNEYLGRYPDEGKRKRD